jgi:hypothetical protein
MANRKLCGWCGQQIHAGEPIKFLPEKRRQGYHELCFWGFLATKGLSYLQKLGFNPPQSLVIRCEADCQVYGARGQGLLAIGRDDIWYERVGDHYEAYHVECSPSKT